MNKNVITSIIEVLKRYRGAVLFCSALLFDAVQTLYFGIGSEKGFNLQPESIAEMICDYMTTGVILVGLILSMFDLYLFKARLENAVNKAKFESEKQKKEGK